MGFVDEVNAFFNDDAGLACARAGDEEEGAGSVGDGGELGGGEGIWGHGKLVQDLLLVKKLTVSYQCHSLRLDNRW